jgi:ketosteroid isomerase-like protein
MSQENVEIFKRAVETWNRDDFEAWIDLFDPEWHTATERAFEGTDSVFRGYAGARKVWESYKGEAFQQLEARYDEFRDLGESVLALGEIKVIGQASQVEVASELAQLLTFRGGKIASSRDFMSHAEGLEAGGLSE